MAKAVTAAEVDKPGLDSKRQTFGRTNVGVPFHNHKN